MERFSWKKREMWAGRFKKDFHMIIANLLHRFSCGGKTTKCFLPVKYFLWGNLMGDCQESPWVLQQHVAHQTPWILFGNWRSWRRAARSQTSQPIVSYFFSCAFMSWAWRPPEASSQKHKGETKVAYDIAEQLSYMYVWNQNPRIGTTPQQSHELFKLERRNPSRCVTFRLAFRRTWWQNFVRVCAPVECRVEFRKVGRFDSMARGAHEPWGQPACFPIRVSACLSVFIVWFLQRVAVLPCQKKMPRVSQSSGLRPSSFWSVWKGIGIVQAWKKRGCTVMFGVCTQHVVASTPSSSSSNSQCRRRTSGRLCQDSWSSSDLASWMGTSSPSWRRLSLQFPWSRCLSSGAAAGPAGIEHRFRAAQCFPPLLCFFPYLI